MSEAQATTSQAERVIRRTFINRTYTSAGVSIALSGLLAALVYQLVEKFRLLLLENLNKLASLSSEILLIGAGVLVLFILFVMVALATLILDWIPKLHVPLGLIFLAWIGFAMIGGLILSPLFYVAGYGLILKAFLATGAIFTATAFLGSLLGIDLTQWGGQILSILTGLVLMGVVNLFLRSEWIEMAWMYGGLVLWIVVAVYAHQLLEKLPLPSAEEIERGGLTRLSLGASLLFYIMFYAIFLRLIFIALSQQKSRRRR
ncbi:MAG: Bax inhibitor-1 family protein [Bacteroidia bacterium]|nr:Bax inhibitor-1 family protein [Bacteroidia bacterium]MDW8015585.1 Bax inhibitor-1 family protein [Bacteroidia bacterium]